MSKKAVDLLRKYRMLLQTLNPESFKNLYEAMESQVNSTGNSTHRWIKISNLTKGQSNKDFIRKLFQKTWKITGIEVYAAAGDEIAFAAIVKFNSHSSARKALESFQWETVSAS